MHRYYPVSASFFTETPCLRTRRSQPLVLAKEDLALKTTRAYLRTCMHVYLRTYLIIRVGEVPELEATTAGGNAHVHAPQGIHGEKALIADTEPRRSTATCQDIEVAEPAVACTRALWPACEFLRTAPPFIAQARTGAVFFFIRSVIIVNDPVILT